MNEPQDSGNNGGNGMQTWVDYRITRGPIKGALTSTIGLILTIKGNRQIEDYMRGLSRDQKIDVSTYGDMWYNCGSDEPLNVYAIEEGFASRKYSLTQVNLPLLSANNDGARLRGPDEETVNLSFLKLVGISRPEGITLGIAGAYSAQYLSTLRLKLPVATEQFLRDHLVPITINLSLIQRS